MNIEVKVNLQCPKCQSQLEDILLMREDGTFMDNRVYCEKCDSLEEFIKEK